MEDRMHRGISFCNVFRVTAIGANSAVQPTIISVLKILLPTTLPMAISALPFRAEDTLTVNSGADVPKATIVSPITILGMRKRLATDAAPSNRMRRSPPISNRMFMKYIILRAKIMQNSD